MEILVQGNAGVAFDALPQTAQRKLLAGVLQVQLLLEREAKETAPRASGMYGQSIASQPMEIVDGVIVGAVGSSIAYAVPLELGSKPHMPPVSPLVPWVKVRFGVAEPEARSIAFRIARKIAKRGTPAAKVFANALAKHQAQAQRILTQSLTDALAEAAR